MSLLNPSPGVDEIVQKQEAEHLIGWYDATLDAASWWSLNGITSLQAATLLCGFNPDGDINDRELVTNRETGPYDFKRLRREFNCVAEASPTPRTLSQWHDVAHDRGLKHHSWIDEYMAARHLTGLKEEGAQKRSAGTDKAALMARHKELIAARCKDPTATLAKEFRISTSRVRAIKRKEKGKPPSGMGSMAKQLTGSKFHRINK